MAAIWAQLSPSKNIKKQFLLQNLYELQFSDLVYAAMNWFWIWSGLLSADLYKTNACLSILGFFSERKWSHWNIRPWNGRHPLSLHDRWTQASLGNINFAFLYQIPRKGILLWKCLLIHRLHLNVNKMTPFDIQFQGARIFSWFMDE